MKLIRLLKSVSPWELKSFQKYVASPFFNVNEKVSKLLQIMIEKYPGFENDEIAFDKLFKKLFKNEKFNHQKLRYVITDLTLLLEDFLAYSVFAEKIFYHKKFLLQKLREKNHDEYFQQHLTAGYRQQENAAHRDLKFYKRQLGYDELSYEFTSFKNNRAIDTSLQSLSDNLDVYFLSNKLKYCCEILNRQNIVQVEYKIPFLDFIIDYLNKNSFDHVPVISVYFQILMTLKENENEKQYEKLKSLLNKYTGF